MRPLSLRMEGLRSYRAETTIDFTQAELIGIIGATGSGKSSILEAMCYALYGLPTGGNEVKELISSGLNTMKVQLVFAADGKDWEVTRSTSNVNRPPVIRLKCLSDDGVGPYDGASDVTGKIKSLIGLDRTGFLSSVILPQGRFAELLDASDAVRAGILKGIFRLEALDEMREVAREVGDELDSYLRAFELERAGFMADPKAAAVQAAVDLSRAKEREDTLRRAQKTCQEKVTAAAEADRLADEAARLAQAISTCLTDRPSQRISPLLAVAKEVESLAERLGKDRTIAARNVALAETRVRELASIGSDAATVQVAADQLNQIAEGLAGDVQEAMRLAREEAELGPRRKVVVAARKELEQISKKVPAGELARDAADRALSRATAARLKGIEKLQAARHLSEESQARTARVATLADRLEQARNRSDTAAKALDGAVEQLEKARIAVDRLRRQHSAAHAAAGLKSGQACPVCRAPLPKGFVAPEAEGLLEAEAQFTANESACASARDAATEAREGSRNLDGLVGEAKGDAKEAEAAAKAAIKALDALLPSSADLVAEDEVILAPLAQQERQATANLEAAAKAVEALRDSMRPLSLKADATEQSIREREESIQRDKEALTARAAHYEAKRLVVQEAVRPSTLSAADIEASRQRARAALSVATKAANDLGNAREQLNVVLAEEGKVGVRRRSEVETPLGPLRDELGILRTRLSDSLVVLPAAKLMAAPAAKHTVADLAAYARKLEDLAQAQSAALSVRAADQAAIGLAANQSVADLLKQHGYDDLEGLADGIATVIAEARGLSDLEALAKSQVQRTDELDKVIRPASDLKDALRELARHLSPGGFIGFVVKRKQRALLGLATDVLQEMTGNRFGFSQDFQIVDTETMQPRSPRTLSGGERFLASLALALGLVELAVRGGGRLDSLFLDEGFGSLDTDAIQDALAALEKVAGHGRMIGLITHIRDVADRLPRVLKVTRTPSGSQVAWLSQQESDEAAEVELSEALLA